MIVTGNNHAKKAPAPTPMHATKRFDVLIIGCGVAGMSLALRLPRSLSICVLGKGNISDSSSYMAQGGIAAAVGDYDSIQSHINDTLQAGAGLCSPETVTRVATKAPSLVDWLQSMDLAFTTNENNHLDLTHEGGHNHRRIVHCADRTGKAMQETLFEQIKSRKNITITNHMLAVDLITAQSADCQVCSGAYILNRKTERVDVTLAKITVLATGGAGKVYLYTSNPDSASGDGIAMAWRAGCQIANMEFMQFHPTCLYHTSAKSFLLSEALRGEGARLLLPNGQEFMHKADARGVLAPRDVVARTIDYEMKKSGLDYVLLDISHRSQSFITKRFPFIYQRCLSFGYDLAKEAIPVVPAVHYTCGGVTTDLEGRTTLPGLYAIGETACTGLHGANRMASNSLLECVAFAQFAGESISQNINHYPWLNKAPRWDESQVRKSDEDITIAHNWHELRHVMWNYVGVFRTIDRLQRAKQRITVLKEEVNEYYRQYKISSDLIELRNLVIVAELIIISALSRHESRGLHYLKDYPSKDPNLDQKDTVLVANKDSVTVFPYSAKRS